MPFSRIFRYSIQKYQAHKETIRTHFVSTVYKLTAKLCMTVSGVPRLDMELTLLESESLAAGDASKSAIDFLALWTCTLYRMKARMATAAQPPPTAPPMTAPETPLELWLVGLAVLGVPLGVRFWFTPLLMAETPVTVAPVTFAPAGAKVFITDSSVNRHLG